MAATVIELDALADAVWPAAQDHDLLAAAGVGLAGAFVIGIEVRSEAFEFRGAGVHAAEDRRHTQFLAPVARRRCHSAWRGERLLLECPARLPSPARLRNPPPLSFAPGTSGRWKSARESLPLRNHWPWRSGCSSGGRAWG